MILFVRLYRKMFPMWFHVLFSRLSEIRFRNFSFLFMKLMFVKKNPHEYILWVKWHSKANMVMYLVRFMPCQNNGWKNIPLVYFHSLSPCFLFLSLSSYNFLKQQGPSISVYQNHWRICWKSRFQCPTPNSLFMRGRGGNQILTF